MRHYQSVEAWRAESDRRRMEETIGEFLRWMNSESGALTRGSTNIMYGHVMPERDRTTAGPGSDSLAG